VDDIWKVVGTICRYVLAVLACWWFFWFLALIGQPAERSQELAGVAFGKAVICGAAAAIWFYRARKAKQAQKLIEYTAKTREAAAPVQADVSPPPVPTEQKQSIPLPESQRDSHPSAIEQPLQPAEPLPAYFWLSVGAAFAVVIGAGIWAYSSRNDEQTTSNPTGESRSTNTTGQGQAPAPAGQKPVDLSDLFGPNANGSGGNSNVASACPPSLPSGVNSKPLLRDQVSNLVGWEGSLYSWEEYDDNARAFLKWKALFGYKNNTNSCITSAVVEVDLDHNGIVSRERHSVVFDPILGLRESRAVDARLNIRTSEGSEDVALTGWRVVGVAGFSSGPPPAYDANGFEIVKDPSDPFVAYGGHEIRATNPKSETPAKVKIPADVAVGLLLQKTQPIYPPIARAARVSGTVVLQATISKAGTVEELRVVSGPPMLQRAALDAVKTWRYKPYTVNNEPVEVETTVNLIFTLSG
jgi:TonB family protein